MNFEIFMDLKFKFQCTSHFTYSSAQLMLEKFSSKELLSSELQDLSARLPWIPEKILKVNSSICNILLGIQMNRLMKVFTWTSY